MEDELYCAVLYTPLEVNGIFIAYQPIGVIKGSYDAKRRIITSSASKREYEMVDAGILHMEDLQNIDVTGLSDVEAGLLKNGLFFAFPITEAELNAKLQYERSTEEGGKAIELGTADEDDEVLYETAAAYYNLFSVYSATDQMNNFYMVDGDSKSVLMVNDLGKDLDTVLDEAENHTINSLPMVSVDIPILNELVYSLRNFLYGSDEEVSNQEKEEEQTETNKKLDPFNFDPDELERLVCSEVIGQEEVISSVVTTLYNNYTYCMDAPGSRSNILIVGPAGCGKSEIVESIRRHLDVPVAIFDMSNSSKTGLVGNSVIQAIRNLVKAAGGDIEKAQNGGIIVFEEIDKIKLTTANEANQGVQDEILTMLSGKDVTVPAEGVYDSSFVFNTSNVTFISCGAFSELFESRKKENKHIGFMSEAPQNVFRPVTTEDFNKSGIKPEVIRRHEAIVTIKNLEEKDLYKITTSSKISHLLIMEEAFNKHDHVVVKREPEYAHKVAEVAKKEDIGASGIKRVVEKSLSVAIRAIRMLNRAGGTLVLRKETVIDPSDFDLYALDGRIVYKKGIVPALEDKTVTTTSEESEELYTAKTVRTQVTSTYDDNNPNLGTSSSGEIENKYGTELLVDDKDKEKDSSKVKRIERVK